MSGIHNYMGFVLAILLFQINPGPGTITILNITARYGGRAGLAAVSGTLCGDAACMLAAVAGAGQASAQAHGAEYRGARQRGGV